MSGKSTPSPEKLNQAFQALTETVHRLRAPDGCPWDRAQTHLTLRPYFIEETFEAIDVIDQITDTEKLKDEKIRASFREELGDVLLQVMLHSEMASEAQAFDIADVADTLNKKLIHRHPHVFGETKASNADEAYLNWEKRKAAEKASQPDSSVLSGVPRGLPALQRAARVIEKVSRVGFQWSDLEGPIEKLSEEVGEFQAEIKVLQDRAGHGHFPTPTEGERQRLEAELGDVLFSICNLALLLKVSPEDALRSTLHRFESRFRHVEKRLKDQGKTPAESNLQEMDRYWDEAKAIERSTEKSTEKSAEKKTSS